MDEVRADTETAEEYKSFTEIIAAWINYRIDIIKFKKLVRNYKFKTAS